MSSILIHILAVIGLVAVILFVFLEIPFAIAASINDSKEEALRERERRLAKLKGNPRGDNE